MKTDSNDCLVSFDVKSLFTQVPVKDVLIIITDRLEHDESLSESTAMTPQQVCLLTELCLKSTYFMNGDQFFEQNRRHSNGVTSLPSSSWTFHGRI